MPELPDITVYLNALSHRIRDQVLRGVRVRSLFVLRTFRPPIEELIDRRVIDLRRIGKRIAIGFEGDHWLVMHLMVAGRLHWKRPKASVGSKVHLAAFDFDDGTLLFTEAGTKKRASLHVFADSAALVATDSGGLEIENCSLEDFSARLQQSNRTLKRALTDPRNFSGIGNAYSDEILHAARLSPVKLTSKLTPSEIRQLLDSTRGVLSEWTRRLRDEAGPRFPAKVTAFRPEMAVHGKFGEPCPVCDMKVQRIRYAENETNYCPGCQTGGRLLADRSLSRLLKGDWPKTAEGWEQGGES